MADKKISQLAEASSLNDSDVMPVVQSSATKKTLLSTIANHVLNSFTLSLGSITRTVKSAIDTIVSDIGTLNTTVAGHTSAISSLNSSITTLNSKTTTKHNATLPSGITGWVDYVQVGYIVVVSVILTNFTTHASGTAVASGLPSPNRNYTTGRFICSDTAISFNLTDTGVLNTAVAFTSSGATIRCMFSYMSNTSA